MLLVSHNLLRYDTIFPEDVVLRINLAWINNLHDLQCVLSQLDNKIFIDYPIGRTKPPANKYNLEDLMAVIQKNEIIKYLAISNVESPADIEKVIDLFSDLVSIVPKIESKKGIENLPAICKVLSGEKILMLDHEDLFSDLVNNNIAPSEFFAYIEKIDDYCKENAIKLLKVRGVIFSDQDKYNY